MRRWLSRPWLLRPRPWRPAIGWPGIALQSALLVAALLSPVPCLAATAELDGVKLPGTASVDGKTLHLNGIGLRTYSILGIHIYVAGLYLEHPNTNAEAIMRSPETKLMKIRFVRNVGADAARDAWRSALEANCLAPCRLDPDDVARFLALVPAMHAGDRYSILFTGRGATVTADGAPLGTITKPQFAAAVLATFIGARPASPRLKAALLQGHD
jgi:Chalcone isomerase-like